MLKAAARRPTSSPPPHRHASQKLAPPDGLRGLRQLRQGASENSGQQISHHKPDQEHATCQGNQGERELGYLVLDRVLGNPQPNGTVTSAQDGDGHV